MAAEPEGAHANTIGGAARLSGFTIQARDVHGGIHLREAPARPPVPRQLLPAPAHFTNRREDLALLDRLFAKSGRADSAQSLIVVNGPAGIGKTALVSRWLGTLGQEFPDGQFYADLRGHSADGPAELGEILGQFLRALGAGSVPADLAEQASLWRSFAAGLRIAVMLDNAFTAAQVRPLLPAGTGGLVVVTSRGRLSGLRMAGAEFHRLEALGPAAGVELLTRGIGEDRVAGELAAVQRIVALCAGLPLAMCLASARLASRPRQPVEALADALAPDSDRLAVLELEGEATVRKALDASYTVLSPDAALLYRRLGPLPLPVFDTLTAAAACAKPEQWAERALDELIEANLIEDIGPDTCRFHDLVRVHAQDRAVADDPAAVRERSLRQVCDWYLQTATAAEIRLTPAQFVLPRTYEHPSDLPVPFNGDAEALGWLDGHRTNLMALVRTAAERGWDAMAWQLVDALWPLFVRLRHYDLWIEAHEIGLAAARRDQEPGAERQMLNSGAIGLSAARRTTEAAAWYEASLRAARAAGDVRDEGQALHGIGASHREGGRFAEAVPYLHQAIEVWEGCGYPRGAALSRIVLGEIALAEEEGRSPRGDTARDDTPAGQGQEPETAADAAPHPGPLPRPAAAVSGEAEPGADAAAGPGPTPGASDRADTELRRAIGYFTAAYDALLAVDDPHDAARALAFLGRAHVRSGETEAGEAQLAAALAAFTSSGATHWQARTLEMLSRCAAERGDTTAAREHAEQALVRYEITSPADAQRLRAATAEPPPRL